MKTATAQTVACLVAITLLQPFSIASFAQELPPGPQSPPANASLGPRTPAAHSQEPDSSKATTLSKFTLQDGTAIKLRMNRNVSSADATVGESVDFEVL